MKVRRYVDVGPLKDVALCAIVRDEIVNPAGGIEEFLDSTLPFVEQGVVVDTGSVDGTREKLEEMQAKYPHLRVVDHKFDGYGPSRNVSLAKSDCKFALVLDADERLTPGDFREIAKSMKKNRFLLKTSYDFDFLHIEPPFRKTWSPEHSRRLFVKKKLFGGLAAYRKMVGEYLPGRFLERVSSMSVKIKHFLPDSEGAELKNRNWYHGDFLLKKSPSKIDGFEEWKRPNPYRVLVFRDDFDDRWLGLPQKDLDALLREHNAVKDLIA